MGTRKVKMDKDQDGKQPVFHSDGFFNNASFANSIIWRLLCAGLAFAIEAIDPFGFAHIYGIRTWQVVSGITTFFVLSVSMSFMFMCIRGIAMVGRKTGYLSLFNSAYTFSQVAFFSYLGYAFNSPSLLEYDIL